MGLRNVEELESQVKELSNDEFRAFRDSFVQFDAQNCGTGRRSNALHSIPK